MHRCTVCGYVYSDLTEDVEFSALADDFKCPVCYADKTRFEKA